MIFSLPFASFASVEFFALLPNPLGDDILGEYIEIRNTGCQSVDIGGYHLYDAASKTYTIPASTIILSHKNIRFPYAITKIVLNNSGSESITLTDPFGSIIDTESYSGTQKDNVVIQIGTNDDNCTVVAPIVNTTGTTNSGTISIGETNTRAVDTSTGTSTGTSATISQENSSTGGIHTGTTDS